MSKIKSVILIFLLFASTNILTNKCFGCEKRNCVIKNNISLYQPFHTKNILLLTNFKANSSNIKQILAVDLGSSCSSILSEDNTESKPFIHLDFSISNCIPDFKEDYYKRKFGLDDRSFHILMKHTTSSICILSFNNLQEENYLSFVVPIDNIILFRQIQI